nr:MAG TPA: hypothetical protein [Caudoviricetes sp.]
MANTYKSALRTTFSTALLTRLRGQYMGKFTV